MRTKFDLFSKMEWLDKEIKRNRISEGRNLHSDYYYESLLKIKKAQKDGSITDDLYMSLCAYHGTASSEQGYYYANIHYDVFEDYESPEEIEQRVIHFLDKADKTVLKEDWFRLNFVYDLRELIARRYNEIPCGLTIEKLFEGYANAAEREAFNVWKSITSETEI